MFVVFGLSEKKNLPFFMVKREAEFHLFAIPLGFWVFLFAGVITINNGDGQAYELKLSVIQPSEDK